MYDKSSLISAWVPTHLKNEANTFSLEKYLLSRKCFLNNQNTFKPRRCSIFIQSMKWSHKDTVWPSYFFALYLFSELYVKELKKWNSDIFFSAEWSFDSTFTCANKIVSFWKKKKKENRLRCTSLVVFIFCKLSWHWPWHEKDETTVTEQSAILSNSASYVSNDHLVPTVYLENCNNQKWNVVNTSYLIASKS